MPADSHRAFLLRDASPTFAHMWIGWAYAMQGKWTQARPAFIKAADLERTPFAGWSLGCCDAMAGRSEIVVKLQGDSAWHRPDSCQISIMPNADLTQQRERVRAWDRAAPALEAMRREAIRQSDATGIRAVIPTAALLQKLGVELSAETGLVEQQAWFAKLRHG